MIPRVQIRLSAPGIKHLTLVQFGLKFIAGAGIGLTLSFLWIGTTLHEKIDALEIQTKAIIDGTNQIVLQAKTKDLDISSQAIKKNSETNCLHQTST